VTVQDSEPPTLNLYTETAALWPPNHEMTAVHPRWTAQDRCGLAVRVDLVSVTSSEPDDAPGTGDGATVNDIAGADVGTADTDLELRAERDGKGPGRVYTLSYRAIDAAGNTTPGMATVVVPHDQGQGPEPLLMQLAPVTSGSSALQIAWPTVNDAIGYDVIRGLLSSVHVEDNVLNLGTVVVLARRISGTTVLEPIPSPNPEVGQGFFYLIEQVTSQGAVGYGTESAPWPRVPVSCVGGCPGEGVTAPGGIGGGGAVRR
jgi:hypothetical protein